MKHTFKHIWDVILKIDHHWVLENAVIFRNGEVISFYEHNSVSVTIIVNIFQRF